MVARWFPPTTGGIERYLEMMYAGLAQSRPVTIVTPKGQNGLPGRSYRIREVRIRARWGTSSKRPLLSLAWHAFLEARTARVICAGHILTGVAAVAIGFVWRRPVVIHCYGLEIANGQLLMLKRATLRRAALVVSISEYTTKLLLSLGVDQRKIVLIPPGVDTTTFTEGPKKSRKARTRFLTVSRLDSNSRYKGHDMIAAALGEMKREGERFEWRIVGEGRDRNYVESLVLANGLQADVTFLGYTDADALIEEYQLADVLVMPNRHGESGATEGFGMVFTEAQACGTPVIAGLAGGTGAAVQDGLGGRRIDGTDVRSVREALQDVIHDPARWAQMGARGQAWVRQSHGWSARVGDLGAAIDRVCGH